MGGMKRLVIFTALFPPLALLIYISPDVMSRREFPPLQVIFSLLGFAYVIAMVPAWLTAAVDYALRAKPSYLRVAASMIAAAVIAELTANYLSHDLQKMFVMVALMGAIPAAVCSLLARERPSDGTAVKAG